MFICAEEMVRKIICFLYTPPNTLIAHILPNKLFLNYTPLINTMWDFRICLIDLALERYKLKKRLSSLFKFTLVKIKNRSYIHQQLVFGNEEQAEGPLVWQSFLLDHLP